MRALVVGCGSIGSRRARLLAEMGHEVWIMDPRADLVPADMRLVEWDNHRDGIGLLAQDAFDERCWYDPGLPDAALVCTPAHTHIEVANQCIQAGVKALFVEKPLSVSMDGIPELVWECEKRGVVTMGACNMRWAYPHLAIWDFAELVVSGPLQRWGPRYTRYREAGLVLEAAVHEIDVALAQCGPIEEIFIDRTRSHGDECVALLLRHVTGSLSEVRADWSADAPVERHINTGAMHYPDTSDEMYRQEMAHFLESVEQNKPTCNPLSSAAETLRWALKARDMTTVVA